MTNNKKKVLIIEDDDNLSTSLVDNIKEAGFEAIRAKDGEEGLILALGSKPDLILLDLILPKLDGVNLLKKLRRNDWGKNVPVIVLSNLNSLGNVADTLAEGVREYLVKVDWGIEDVIKKVREKIGN